MTEPSIPCGASSQTNNGNATQGRQTTYKDINNDAFTNGGAMNVQLLTLENINLNSDQNGVFSTNLYFNNSVYTNQIDSTGKSVYGLGLSTNRPANGSANVYNENWSTWNTGNIATTDYLTYLTGYQFNKDQNGKNVYLISLRDSTNIATINPTYQLYLQQNNGLQTQQLGDSNNKYMSSTINPSDDVLSTLSQLTGSNGRPISLTTQQFNWNNIAQIARTPATNSTLGSNKNYVSSDSHPNIQGTGTWNLSSNWTKNGGSQGQFQSMFGYFSDTTKLNASAFRNEHYNLIYQKNVLVFTGLPGRVQRSELSYTPQIENMVAKNSQLKAQQTQMMWDLIASFVWDTILVLVTMAFLSMTSALLLEAIGSTSAVADGLLIAMRSLSLAQKLEYLAGLYLFSLGLSISTDLLQNGLPNNSNKVDRAISWLGWAAVNTAFMFLDGLGKFAEQQEIVESIINKSEELRLIKDYGKLITNKTPFFETIFGKMALSLHKISRGMLNSFISLQIGQLMNNDFTVDSISFGALHNEGVSSSIGKLILGGSLGMAFYYLAGGILSSIGIEEFSSALIVMSAVLSITSMGYLFLNPSQGDQRFQVNIMFWLQDIAQSSQHSNNILLQGFGSFLGVLSGFVYHDFVTQRLFTSALTDPFIPQLLKEQNNTSVRDSILQEYGVTIDPNFKWNITSYGYANQLNFDFNVLQMAPMFGLQLYPRLVTNHDTAPSMYNSKITNLGYWNSNYNFFISNYSYTI